MNESGTVIGGARQSLRSKFVRALLLVTAFIGVAAVAIVAGTSARASGKHLALVQQYIEQGITSKGKVLTENHARALRGLTLDNAFLDMQRLVDRAVREDADIVYGLYVGSEGETLAFSRQGQSYSGHKPPRREAWRSLGIGKSGLIVQRTRVTRARRMGRDLLEVAVPVFGEDEGEILGTVRYGLSTARMRDAKAQASSEAESRLKTSILWIISLIAFAMLLALLLSRLIAARITRPVAELTVAAGELAAGNRQVRVAIESGDELEILGASFNGMVEDLDASYGALEEMNRTLEQKVEDRTVELARRNRDMRLVLDNVDEGFISVGADGTMALERSRVVNDWFGPCDQPKQFADYMSQTSPAFGLVFQLGWEQLREDILPLELTLDQLPRRLVHAGRTWRFRYLPFQRGGELEGVLVVVEEITKQLIREREEAEQSELMQGFKRLMLDRSGFSSFLRGANRMVETICSRQLDEQPTLHRRQLHTLKGNSASMGLTVVARLCHALEDQLEQAGRTSDEALAELASRWNIIKEHIAVFSGDARQRMIEVSESDYMSLVSRLSADGSKSDILHELLTWQLEPVTRPLGRLAEEARALARQLNKGEIEVEIQGNGVRLDQEAFGPLFSELVHLIRNAVDHGLEPPEEREIKQKPRRGTLVLKASAARGVVDFEVSDDGRGIDWSALTQKAKALGLPHASQSDLTQALMTDGVTTRDTVSETSGRGVGMAALLQRVSAMGGRIEVSSKRDVGTCWVLSLPWAPPSVTATSKRLQRFEANGRSGSLIPPA